MAEADWSSSVFFKIILSPWRTLVSALTMIFIEVWAPNTTSLTTGQTTPSKCQNEAVDKLFSINQVQYQVFTAREVAKSFGQVIGKSFLLHEIGQMTKFLF